MKKPSIRALAPLTAALLAIPFLTAAPAHAGVSAGVNLNVLTITGDAFGDQVALRLRQGDPSTLDVDLDDDGVAEGGFPRNTFASITIDMGGGADGVRIDETNGVYTDTEIAQILGGEGSDALISGSGSEMVDGGGGDDLIVGGPEFDQLRGGAGNDQVHWTPGDGDGLIEGGEGADTALVAGSLASDEFLIERFPAEDGDVRIAHVGSGRVAGSSEQRLREVERLDLNALSGDDRITAAPGVGRVISLDITAGPAGTGETELTGDDDVVVGSDDADVIRGGIGIDSLDGRGGDDALHGGKGDDNLTGGLGFDALTGADGADTFGCDQQGEAVDPAPNDLVPALCIPVTATTPAASTSPSTAAASAPAAAGLTAGFLGFVRPGVRATRTGLRVKVANVHTAAIDVEVAVREPFAAFGRPRVARYRVVRAHIAPGTRATLKLRAPAVLRRQIAARLRRGLRVVRRPRVSVTNVATGGTRSVRPRLRLVAG